MKMGMVGALMVVGAGMLGGAGIASAEELDQLNGAWRQSGGTCRQLDYVWTRTGYDTFRYQCQDTSLGSCDFNDVQVNVRQLKQNTYQIDYPKGVWEQFRFRGPNTVEFFASSQGYNYKIERCN